jgi:diguanylate cyclase (GGDEF)-like protein
VLVFSNDRDAGERLSRWVAAAGERPVVLSGAEKYLIEEGDDETIDLIVTDLDTDDPSARALLNRLLSREAFADVPQIHLFRDLALRDELLGPGASGTAFSMVSPPEAVEFQARVRLASEVGRLRRELSRTSVRDPLTGLFNRRWLVRRLEEEYARARRYRNSLALVFFDIDKLRAINDTFGETAGDSVILRVSEILKARVRKEDVLGRIGEESFGAILPGNHYRGAAVFAGNVRTEISERMSSFEKGDVSVRISAGITSYPEDRSADSADHLIRAAEKALAEAKARGGNRVFIHEAVLRSDRYLILVVDPDRHLLELAEDLLAMDDHRIVVADSGRTALETLRFRRPDLLVVDLQMAERDGGRPLIERIHDVYPKDRFPVIGLSRDPDIDPEKMTSLGVDRFITKPFSLSLLRSVAQELLTSFRPALR